MAVLSFELTTRCNLRCQFCPRRLKDSSFTGDMPYSLVERVVDEFVTLAGDGHGFVITPVGLGEPFLYRELFKVLHLIHERMPKALIQINTNCLLLRRYTEDLLKSPLTHIVLSVNCLTRNTYLNLHGVDRLQEVTTDIEHFLKVKGARRPEAIVQMLWINDTKPEHKRFINYWKPKLNSNDHLSIRQFCDWAGLIPVEKWLRDPLRPDFPCIAIFDNVLINKQGDIYPCCVAAAHHPEKTDLLLGNIKHQSLITVLRDKKLQEIKRKHWNGDITMSPCNICRTPSHVANITNREYLKKKGIKFLKKRG